MGLFGKRGGGGAPGRGGAAAVQTARSAPPGWAEVTRPLLAPEHRLYERLRATVPIVDAALGKIVRLAGGFSPECGDPAAQGALERFCREVRVGCAQRGLEAFAARYLDDLLTYGGAAGEIVLNAGGDEIYALYNSPLENLEVAAPHSPVQAEYFIRDGLDLRPAPRPELLLYTALNPPAGEARGVPLLRGLPFVGETLLRIYECVGRNFERAGNLRYAVTCRPGGEGVDPAGARELAADIAREWGQAMSAAAQGQVRDFVAVGDVEIKVIGADSPMLDTKIPVDQLLQQIVSKLGLPPFLLGLSWSTTERMSKQQADILTSELEAYRRLITPPLEKILNLALAMEGRSCGARVRWEPVNLQDELEEAQARLLLARAAREERGGD